MSQASDLRRARDEALRSGRDPSDILEALCLLNRKIDALGQIEAAQERNRAWSAGRRGDGVAKIAGLTDTLTSLLRRFGACGVVRYEDVPDLHRQVSALRKWCKTGAPTIRIDTLIGEGYEIARGFDELYRLLNQSNADGVRAPGFTVKQTAILQLIALRGSAHVDQVKTLQRHMSNIRAKLKKQGHAKRIAITTHAGEGLYTIDDKGREALTKLLAGEPLTKTTIAPLQLEPPRLAA